MTQRGPIAFHIPDTALFDWKFNHIKRGVYEINTSNCGRASTPLANTAAGKA
jgi:hypothetical protein